jgi:excisionase family DNA binding protein
LAGIPVNSLITITDVWTGTAPRTLRAWLLGPRYLTPREVAARLSGKVSLREIYKLFHAGSLRGTRIGRKVLIYEHALDELIRAGENAPKEKAPPAKRGPAGPRKHPGTFRHFPPP